MINQSRKKMKSTIKCSPEVDHYLHKIIFALHLSLAFLRYNPASLCLYHHICTAFDEDKERSTTHAHR